MQSIVLASRKGGAGKTTLTCHLAVEAERAGNGPIGIIDTDEMAGLAKWWDAREVPTPLLAKPEPDLKAALALLRQHGCRLVFVDTPPAASSRVSATIQEADLVLIPVQPSPDDLRAVGATVNMVESCGKRLIFVINRVKPRVRLTGQVAIALSQHGTVAPDHLFDRIDYAAAKVDGLTAPEIDPNGPASAEITALWSYIARKIGVTNEEAVVAA